MPEEPTTPDIVELSRQVFGAMVGRDFGAVEGFYAPDAIYRGEQVGTYEGAAAIRGLFEDMLSPYEEFHGEVEEIVDLGNAVVFAVISANGRPAGSSAFAQVRLAGAAVWANGVIERQTAYLDIDEGRAVAERLAQERG